MRLVTFSSRLKLHLLPAALAFLFAAACTRSRTEIVIGVATDLAAPSSLDRVRLIVERSSVPILQHEWDISGIPAQPFELPGSFGVYSSDGSEPTINIRVMGYLGSQLILERTSILSLVREQTLFLRMALVSRCMNNSECAPQGRTCVEGRCILPQIDARLLPLYRAGIEGEVQCQSGTVLINTGTGQPLGVTGSGQCAAGQKCVESICYGVPPSCTDGQRNGEETDIDCGGTMCAACPGGRGCATDGDCESQRCGAGQCAFARFTFAGALSLPGIPSARAVAVADLDRDGRQDLIAASDDFNAGGVYITAGQQDGFAPPVNVAGGSSPVALAVADFNADNRLDIAAADPSTNQVAVLLGQAATPLRPGLIDFLPAQNYPVGQGPAVLAAADLDNDSRLDLLTLNSQSGDISLLFGGSGGTFQAQPSITVGPGANGVAIGDLNLDRRLDLVVTNETDGSLTVLLGQAQSPFFGPPTTFSLSTPILSIAMADFNGDGRQDLVLGEPAAQPLLPGRTPDRISLRLGRGDGSFDPPSYYPVGNSPRTLAVRDLDGDGRLDVVAANQDSGDVSVLRAIPGGFASAADIAAGDYPAGLAVGDINSDGVVDIAVADLGSINLLVGQGGGALLGARSQPLDFSPSDSSSVADFNGDARPDVALLDSSTAQVVVFPGQGDGSVATPLRYDTGLGSVNDLAQGDLNGDTRPDLVVAGASATGASAVSVLLGAGPSGFVPAATYAVGGAAQLVSIADVSGDTHPDLVVYGSQSNFISVLPGQGDGKFQRPYTIDIGQGQDPQRVVARDLVGNSNVDLAVAVGSTSSVSVLMGLGAGTFAPPQSFPTDAFPQDLVAGDFNGDGRLDLATSSGQTQSVRVLVGQFDGTFIADPSYLLDNYPRGLAAADVDGDAIADLVVTGTRLTVIRGRLDAALGPARQYYACAFPTAPRIADLDRDGKPDLIVPCGGGEGPPPVLSVLRNVSQ